MICCCPGHHGRGFLCYNRVNQTKNIWSITLERGESKHEREQETRGEIGRGQERRGRRGARTDDCRRGEGRDDHESGKGEDKPGQEERSEEKRGGESIR